MRYSINLYQILYLQLSLKILLTNDDGIHAPGINAIYEQIKKFAHIDVIAPDSERSSVGHGITLAHPIVARKFYRNKKIFGTAVSGTPADCVKFAIGVMLKKKPDLIISGINLGCNDGCSIFYSGTVAAAREGSLLGIPSIALSLDTFVNPDFAYAAKCGARIAKQIHKCPMPKGTFLNINIPSVKHSQIKGIKWVKQGTIPIHGNFLKRKDPNLRDYYWMSGKVPVKKKNNSVDTFALANRYVTVTPIQSDATDYDYLEQLNSTFND